MKEIFYHIPKVTQVNCLKYVCNSFLFLNEFEIKENVNENVTESIHLLTS